MSQTGKQLLRKELTGRSYRYLAEEEDVYQYIVQESAASQIRKLGLELEQQLHQVIMPLLQDVLVPQLQVRHVGEEGLQIWGKADNVAFSKATIVGLLEMLRPLSDAAQFRSALVLAGRQAAMGFFDQFRRILRVGNETGLPKGVIPFLRVLGEFDERSGWWEKIDYDDSHSDSVSVTISRPFWRFPYMEKENHHLSDFAVGYIMSLHNCCYDYLAAIAQLTESRLDDWFAVEARVFSDPDLDKCHLLLRRTRKTVAETDHIGALVCVLVEWLLDEYETDRHRDEILVALSKLGEEINNVFGEEAHLDQAKLREIQVNQHQYRPEFVRNALTDVLQKLRCQYEDLRIAKLRG